MNSVSRRFVVAMLSLVAFGVTSTGNRQANPTSNVSATLFRNVRIFDGQGTSLSAPSNKLVEGNFVGRISTEPIPAEAGVIVNSGNGKTLMPGLIDARWHPPRNSGS
jgi:putative methionine-R-sulfoxide reductase with GAF domain